MLISQIDDMKENVQLCFLIYYLVLWVEPLIILICLFKYF